MPPEQATSAAPATTTAPATSAAAPATGTTAAPATATGTAPVAGEGTQAAPATGTAPATGDGTQPAAATPRAPADYAAFTLPDGFTLDGTAADELKAVAKKLDLTQAQAQELVNREAERSKTTVTARQAELNHVTAAWQEATKADKEIGGEKLPATLTVAQKAFGVFGSPALRTMLDKSGLGNHPEIIRAFYKVGLTLKEDMVFPAGDGTGKAADAASALYPKQPSTA